MIVPLLLHHLTTFHLLDLYSAYTMSKANSELIISSFLEQTDIKCITLRPPLVYSNPCPGRLSSLVKAIQFFPFLPFGSLTNYRSFVSLNSLINAIYVVSKSSCL